MQLEKLTDKGLKALKATGKRYDVSIKNGQSGLYLRVSATGALTFWYLYQLKGERHKMIVGSYPAVSLHGLLIEYNKLASMVKRGIDPLRERELASLDADPLFEEFAERFILQHVKKHLAPATAKEYERQIRKHFIPAWGKRKVIDIQRKQIVKLIEKISDTAPIQANRTLATIKKMFSYAFDVGIVNDNPATRIKPPGKEKPRTRVLDLQEISTLFKTLGTLPDRDTRDILQLITLTAQRPGEVAEMRLSQLKEDEDGLWFELSSDDVKNSEPTRIYLNDMARDIIKSRIEEMELTRYIFPADSTSGFMRKDVLVSKVRRLQEATGIDYFTAHDLRRSAATGLAKLGHGAVVDDVLNHKQKGITRRVYDLYSRAPEIKRALTAWGEAIQRAVAGTQADVIEIKTGSLKQ